LTLQDKKQDKNKHIFYNSKAFQTANLDPTNLDLDNDIFINLKPNTNIKDNKFINTSIDIKNNGS
jgi:hypothetical protein